ncbi:MAG: DUF5985 family protein [Myxococcota bacterium]
MNQFLSGAIMMACWVVGMMFLRFWSKTRDRLFLMFAVAFWILAVERIALVVIWLGNEVATYVFVIRLIAFAVIIAAVADKNRSAHR